MDIAENMLTINSIKNGGLISFSYSPSPRATPFHLLHMSAVLPKIAFYVDNSLDKRVKM